MRRQTWSMLVVSLVLSTPSRADEKAPSEEEPIYQGKTLTEWIGDLKDPNRNTHRCAAETLDVFGPKKEVVAALTSALKNTEDELLVISIARTLGKFGPSAKESLPALRAAFKELEKPRGEMKQSLLDECRQTIAEALVLIDDHPGPELAPFLREALKTTDANLCRDIAIKLGDLGADAAKTTVPTLIALLADTEKMVDNALKGYLDNSGREKAKVIRLEAVKSLGRIGPAARPAVHALTLALKEAAPGKDAVSASLFPGDKAMLQACAEALGRIRPDAKGTAAAMRLALRDLDEEVRWAALQVLIDGGKDHTVLHDKDAALRRAAVKALGLSGGEAKHILLALTTALKDKDASVRASAAKALGDMGSKAKQAVPALIEALKEADLQVRGEAAESLGKIGAADKEVVPALIAALSDESDCVFRAAGSALAKFGARAKTAVPPLLNFLQDDDPQKRAVVCILLCEFGAPAAKDAIPALERISQKDSEKAVRLVAHTALAKIDSGRLKDTVRRLIAALQSKNNHVSATALECLEILGPDAHDALPALRALREHAGDINETASSLDDTIKAIENPKKDSGKR